VGEFWGEGRGEGVEVVALVLSEAARRDHFLQVRVGRLRGEGGAGAEDGTFVLNGVAVPVPHRSTGPARPRHRREMT